MGLIVQAKGVVNAPQAAVWSVLADDFANIADWNSGFTSSKVTSTGAIGVGTERECRVGANGRLEETLRVFEPPSKMVISVDKTYNLPLKSSITTFLLSPKGADATEVTMTADVESKLPKPVALLLAPLRKIRFSKALMTAINDMEAPAQKRAK